MMRRFWTNTERRRAVELRVQGYSYDKIACLLASRTGHAVAAHLRSLRLSPNAAKWGWPVNQ